MKRFQRLSERGRFQQVRREGRSWSERLVVMCVLPNGLSWSRFGFSVSRHVGKAVVRNQMRRRLREVIRLRQSQIADGWDLVFIARTPIVTASYQDIELTCERLLERAGLLKPLEPT